MSIAVYGIAMTVTGGDTGETLVIQRALDAAFTVSLTTVFTKANASSGVGYPFTDYFGKDGITRYYRAYTTRSGATQSANSGTYSSIPRDLSI